MRMTGMYREDKDTQKALEGIQSILHLEEKADIVLEGVECDLTYNVTKPAGGVNGVLSTSNPYQFILEHLEGKDILIKHQNGLFERYTDVHE